MYKPRASNHIDRLARICVDLLTLLGIRPVLILGHIAEYLLQIHTGCTVQKLHTRHTETVDSIASEEGRTINQMRLLLERHILYNFLYFHSFSSSI